MFGLVTSTIVLAGETTFDRLRTALDATKQGLCVPLVVLSEVTAPAESYLGRAPWVSAGPSPVNILETPV